MMIDLRREVEPKFNLLKRFSTAQERADRIELESALRKRIEDSLPSEVPSLKNVNFGKICDIKPRSLKVNFRTLQVTGICSEFKIPHSLEVDDYVSGLVPDFYNIGSIEYGPPYAGFFYLDLYKNRE